MSNAVTKIQATGQPRWLATPDLEEMKRKGLHVLVPTQFQSQVSSLWQGVYEAVLLSPVPEHKDCWPLPGGGGKVGLSKTGLMKIARAAGIELYKSEVEERSVGYIRTAATIRQRNASGAWEYTKATKSFERAILLEEELATQMSKVGKKFGPINDAEAQSKAEATIRRFWKFNSERCETGAFLRCIRSVLSIRGDYSPQELTKPFIVRAIHFAPDQADPELRSVMLNAAKLTAVQLWGNRPEDQHELQVATGRTIAELTEDQAAFQQLKNVDAIDDGPHNDDFGGTSAAEIAVRGATPADVNFLADEEEV
jgi:hypothetical protein